MKFLDLVTIGMTLGIMDVSAMVGYVPDVKPEKKFDMSQPLSEWAKIDPLTTRKEIECYRMLWNPRKTLKENRKELVNNFIKTVCDFSFKTIPLFKEEEKTSVGNQNGIGFWDKYYVKNDSDNEDFINTEVGDDFCEEMIDLRGMYKGKDESGEIMFLDSGDYNCRITHLGEFIIDNGKGKSVEIDPNIRILKGMCPLDMNKTVEKKIKQYLKVLSQDSVGCELLRIAITKHKTGGLKKLTFIPIMDDNWGISYISGYSLAQDIGLEKVSKKDTGSNKYIIFSIVSLIKGVEEPLIERILTKDGKEQYKVTLGEVPVDASLYYSLLYSWQDKRAGAMAGSRKVIEKRVQEVFKRVKKDLKGMKNDTFYKSNEKLNNSFFINDLEYKTVFGLTRRGISLENQSAYLAHRYNYMRCSHIGVSTEFFICNEAVSQKEMYNLLVSFFNLGYGDNELYAYYLSKEFSQNYPEFGSGNYCCSDLNQEKLVANKRSMLLNQ